MARYAARILIQWIVVLDNNVSDLYAEILPYPINGKICFRIATVIEVVELGRSHILATYSRLVLKT